MSFSSRKEGEGNQEIVFDKKGLWVEIQRSNSDIEYTTQSGQRYIIPPGGVFFELHFTPKNINFIDPSKVNEFLSQAFEVLPEFIEWKKHNYPEVQVLIGQTHPDLGRTVKKRLGFDSIATERTSDRFGQVLYDYSQGRKEISDDEGHKTVEELDHEKESHMSRLVTSFEAFERSYEATINRSGKITERINRSRG